MGWGGLERGVSRVCIILGNIHVFFPPSISFSLVVLRLSTPSCSVCRAFTVTAIAQMCILGLMWVFGAFLFRGDNIAVAYIFTILNSLQGALVFVMHCLLSKQVGLQGPAGTFLPGGRAFSVSSNFFLPVFCCPLQVREEYAYFFACSRMPQKKRHSDFSSSNPSSSQSQVCHEKHWAGLGFQNICGKNNKNKKKKKMEPS